MKKAVLLFVALVIGLSGFSQDGDRIFIGVKDTLYSSILDEDREIWVSVPSDVRSYLVGQEFPVVVVLDGPDHFYSVVGMVDRFSNNASNEICPPMIVVGLVNTDRFRDFYPELPDDNFTLFLKDELLPYIDENYPTKPYRILIGHSLGGLIPIKAAIYNKGVFNGYISIDPSLGIGGNKWYDEVKGEMANFDPENDRMFVAMAQTMRFDLVQDTADVKKDTTENSNHMRRIMEFSESLSEKNRSNKNNFSWKFYPDETHQSVTQKAMYDGIEFIFDGYRPRFWDRFYHEGTSPEEAIELYDNYYKAISEKLGYEVKSPFDDSMLIGYLEYKQWYEKALAVAKYNATIHPENEKAKEWIEKLENKMKDY